MPIHPIIQEMYRTGRVASSTGEILSFDSGITPKAGEKLFDLTSRLPPGSRLLEIGMAFGTSTLQLLSGLTSGGDGSLTVIDPFQETYYKGVALKHVREAGWENRLRFIGEPSHFALPELVRRGEKFDLCFIDGNHTFDYVFIDFFFCDLLLSPGGRLVFHDTQMWSVSKVVRFLLTHKAYREEREHRVPCSPVQRVQRYVAQALKPTWYLKQMMGLNRDERRKTMVGRGSIRVPFPHPLVSEPLSFPAEMLVLRKTASREILWNEYHEF